MAERLIPWKDTAFDSSGAGVASERSGSGVGVVSVGASTGDIVGSTGNVGGDGVGGTGSIGAMAGETEGVAEGGH